MHIGDVRDVLDRLAADGETFDQAITSPPFLALRSYLPADHPDKHREIGSEPTPAAFLDTCYGWTAQLGEVLPEWASICVELGDTMSGSGGAGGDYNADGLRAGQAKFRQVGSREHRAEREGTSADGGERCVPPNGGPGWPLAKSMCILPHAYTLGLAYGHNPLTGAPSPAGQWRIRNVVAWARPNPPVGSLGKRNPDRRTGDYKFRPATSFITIACRGTGRYFDLDAVRTEFLAPDSNTRNGLRGGPTYGLKGPNTDRRDLGAGNFHSTHGGAPPLDWHADQLDGDWLWKLATAPYPGSHYATYPLTLPRRLILAMCPQRVCRECGWPSERISQSSVLVDGKPVDDPKLYATRFGGDRADGGADRTVTHKAGPSRTGINNNRVTSGSATLGWTDCECVVCRWCGRSDGHDTTCDGAIANNPSHIYKWRPGRVLDIFGGSGTTAVAAALEQRDCTLIDLDRRNVDLVRRRLTETVRIVSEDVDGDTVTWTVETVAPTELAAIAAGQASLFGDTA
jgi:site-specific DNA-methyltransferase (cytosine-N4-specific)